MEENYKGLTIKLEPDQDCESPLVSDDVHITYRKGARTILGNDPVEYEEFERIGAEIDSGLLIGRPVYAYVHSGVALRTGSFQGLLPQGHAEFDSGQSGYIYVTKKTALEWHGGKVLSAKKREKTLESLESVLSEFAKWLNGDCWGFIIEDENGKQLDSCWGFIGQEYAMEAAKEAADSHATSQELI